MAADVAEKLVPALQETAGQNEDHLFCCDEDISLCGISLRDMDFGEFDEATCTVCHQMEQDDTPCSPECTGRGYR